MFIKITKKNENKKGNFNQYYYVIMIKTILNKNKL